MMYEDDIKKLNKWFRKKEKDSLGTYHHTKRKDGEDVYAVDTSDVEEFCDFLRENILDMIGFNCMVGNDGIWFSSDDLKRARFY